jgi:hypothetical protein
MSAALQPQSFSRNAFPFFTCHLFATASAAAETRFRISDFGFPSDFGFRISDFTTVSVWRDGGRLSRSVAEE